MRYIFAALAGTVCIDRTREGCTEPLPIAADHFRLSRRDVRRGRGTVQRLVSVARCTRPPGLLCLAAGTASGTEQRCSSYLLVSMAFKPLGLEGDLKHKVPLPRQMFWALVPRMTALLGRAFHMQQKCVLLRVAGVKSSGFNDVYSSKIKSVVTTRLSLSMCSIACCDIYRCLIYEVCK